MVEDDVQLIRRVLSDDDEAFNILVQRYQRGVHALVWRKVSDFHYAEEITQDTFLQAYKKLSTLKNPKQFAGWLYVIANRFFKGQRRFFVLIGSKDTNPRCNRWRTRLWKK